MKKSFYILSILLICATKVAAVSAFPWPVKITQPDGSSVTVVQKGDEHVHWMETSDGMTLMKNARGYITYATTDSKGNMIASDIVAQDATERSDKAKSFLSGQTRKIFFSQLQLDSMTSQLKASIMKRQKSSALPTGTVKILVVLMGFQDVAFTKTTSDFNNLFNQTGYSVNNNQSSVKDFFTTTSYGKFAMNFDVKGPFTASRPRSYYGKDVGGLGNDQHPDSLVVEAIRAVHTTNPSFDFSGYSAINVIFAGNGQEFTSVSTDAIWSHQNDFTPPSYCSITHYLCTPELYANSPSVTCTMGVLCHELNHVIGAPDYYDTNYDNTGDGSYIGTGAWDLMAEGSWNRVGLNYYGTCPPNLTLYQKYRYGWIAPVELKSPTTISNMAANGTKGEAYIFKTLTQGEYYMLENRQQTGYDSSLPGHGLLIYHIAKDADDLYYDLNITSPQKVYPVCASATTNPTSTAASYGNIDSGGCAFPGTSGKTSFTDSTTPSAKSWDNTLTGKPITNISENGGTISFDFMKNVNVGPAPLNLTGKVSNTDYVLSWTAPTAIPQIGDSIQEVHWDGAALDGALSTGQQETMSCAQVFSSSTLASYVGKTFAGVKFYPYDANASAYHIQVFEYSSSTNKMVLKLDESVTGVKTSQWNEMYFTNPLSIQAGKVYAIGVQYTSASGYTVSVDRGPKIESTTAGNYGAVIIESGTPYTIGATNDYNFNVRGLINKSPLCSYNIYFNGDSIGNTTSLDFTIPSAKSGTYCLRTVNNGIVGTESACIDYIAPKFTEPYILCDNEKVIVYGMTEGTQIYVYSPVGKMIKNVISDGNPYSFTLPTGAWIVKAGALTKKLIIK
ncbi:M6 family metalloprotease domain-containing protein [Paludibacter jiangxiensis]|uniref:M6 family metalloprotease domain-containing protein n=1 Tax=Paludibacter jiangxiensis TaxID=681398 RepID=A0A171AHF8_9BACT|nr:M6 family metalloprotease domain-containing protein [Paludibacter jiangxiensis]GAT63736.1 M6 family metalloprotease domain-containing protein [Paludibacter jiangxiensis]